MCYDAGGFHPPQAKRGCGGGLRCAFSLPQLRPPDGLLTPAALATLALGQLLALLLTGTGIMSELLADAGFRAPMLQVTGAAALLYYNVPKCFHWDRLPNAHPTNISLIRLVVVVWFVMEMCMGIGICLFVIIFGRGVLNIHWSGLRLPLHLKLAPQ
jgi:hypothetical protein